MLKNILKTIRDFLLKFYNIFPIQNAIIFESIIFLLVYGLTNRVIGCVKNLLLKEWIKNIRFIGI